MAKNNKLNGIDVSYHQGTIDWDKVKKHISFAMIRAGYGNGVIDKQFERNSSECERLNIPYGVYWFSYAKNQNEAVIEANHCIKAITGKNITYPVVFDFEYASDENAVKNNYKLNNTDRYVIAKSFLDEIEKAGYYAMIYTNKDYLSKGFLALTERYDVWFARWGDIEEPGYKCGLWQWSDKGKVEGINGNVDLNVAFKDYPALIQKNKTENSLKARLEKLFKELEEIIKGM